MKTVVLYSTLGCHLCEQAKALILPLLDRTGFQLEEKDIGDSDELMKQYQLTIPVVRKTATGEELNWPFDADQLEAFLKRD